MKVKDCQSLMDTLSVVERNLEHPASGVKDPSESGCSRAPDSESLRPCFIGAVTSLSVVGFYLGLLTLTSDWHNAVLEFQEYGIWIIALAMGLGVQVTLFSRFRAWRRGESGKAATYSLVASGGMSTTAMAACCAHYLAFVLPALGLPFLSATVASLAGYQVYFFVAGVISNLFGIGLTLWTMRRSGMIQWRSSRVQSLLSLKNAGSKGDFRSWKQEIH